MNKKRRYTLYLPFGVAYRNCAGLDDEK